MPDRNTEVDVLVVGAGPGGSSAAYHLARHGVDVLMVEKSAFPREKVCGDGFTPRGVRAMQQLGVDTTEAGFSRIDGLRVYRDSTPMLHMHWPDLDRYPSYGVVRTRHDFDDLLAQRAVKVGATLWEQSEALEPLFDQNDWVTGARIACGEDAEPVEVHAKLVMAADGASSRFASPAGVSRNSTRPLGVAARRYYRSDREIGPWMESWLEIADDDGNIVPGYGWIFPVGGGIVNVGAGLMNTFVHFKGASAKGTFDRFEKMLDPSFEVDPDHEESPLLSGPIPMGMNRTPMAAPGLLLIGDAGGITNPFNGEGIAFAMESGELAAELVYDGLAAGKPALAQAYPTMLRETYGRYFWLGRKFVGAIGHPKIMEFSTTYGLPRPRLMAFLLKLMTGLTDGRDGNWEDRLIAAIERVVPAS